MKKIIILTIGLTTTLVSCKKEKEEVVTGPGKVNMSTRFVVDGASYNQDSIYTDDFGNDFKISLANFYLSGFKLSNSSGSVSTSTQYLLVKPETSTYSLGNLKEANYSDITFDVGVDSVTNHTDPNTYSISSPLYPQTPSMHWTWASGYIFYKLEGTVDTDGDGTFESTFLFHIGTDGMLRNISYALNQEIVGDKTNTISMKIDLAQFLDNIDLSIDNSTHTMNNMPLALRVVNNSTSAFSK